MKQEIDPMELFWNPQSIRPLGLGRVPSSFGQCIESKEEQPMQVPNQEVFTIGNAN
jgi:hypothetical protein